jgi:hypothetical protein
MCWERYGPVGISSRRGGWWSAAEGGIRRGEAAPARCGGRRGEVSWRCAARRCRGKSASA